MAQYALVKCNINGKDVEKIVDVRASLTDMPACTSPSGPRASTSSHLRAS